MIIAMRGLRAPTTMGARIRGTIITLLFALMLAYVGARAEIGFLVSIGVFLAVCYAIYLAILIIINIMRNKFRW
jgi:hypothetical protein